MTASERDAKILGLEAQVRILACRRHRALPSTVSLCDLISAAWVGAIKAVDGFDPLKNTCLTTYAEWKIRSAMADYLRILDPLSRQHRQEVNRSTELMAPVTISISPIDGHNNGFAERLVDMRAKRDATATDAKLDVERIICRANLPARSLRIVRRRSNGDRMRAIGISEGIGQGRVSQIYKRSLILLRAAA